MDNDARCQEGGTPVALVNLVSGGLDSTLVGVLACELGLEVFPLFVDYGQRAAKDEWDACQRVHSQLGLPPPARIDVSGFGSVIRSGLTFPDKDVYADAFTPGRNLLFLLLGSAYAYQLGVEAVAIGLLSDAFSLFPDQRSEFITKAEETIELALGRRIKILVPLAEFNKAAVIQLARAKGVVGTYSCHSGGLIPCGRCIPCLEILGATGGR